MELSISPKISEIFSKILISTVSHCVCVYSTKVTILSGKLPIISFIFVQQLKKLIETNIKHTGLNTSFSHLSPKLRILLSPPPSAGPSLRQWVLHCNGQCWLNCISLQFIFCVDSGRNERAISVCWNARYQLMFTVMFVWPSNQFV